MKKQKTPGAPSGNRNAAKENPRDSLLAVRCLSSEKAAWVRAAKPGKLADWLRSTLNKAAS